MLSYYLHWNCESNKGNFSFNFSIIMGCLLQITNDQVSSSQDVTHESKFLEYMQKTAIWDYASIAKEFYLGL